MSARTIVRAAAGVRVLLGGALLAAPGPVGRAWIGSDAARPPAAVALRAMGVRDLVLGMMAAHTAGHPEVAPRWQRTLALVDLTDLAATLAARRALAPSAVAGVGALAVGAAGLELWLAARLAAGRPEEMAEPTG